MRAKSSVIYSSFFQQANFVYQCILHLIRHCYIVKVKHFINDIFAQQAQLKKAGVGITVQIALRELACFFPDREIVCVKS